MKKGKSRLIRLAACSAALVMTAALSGCGIQAENAFTQTQGYKIVVIGQAKNVQFWDYVEQGATDAGRELSYDVEYYNAEDTNDIAGQEKLIQDAIDKNVHAIVVAPNSASELNNVLRNAQEKGITVLTIDADIDSQGLRSAYIGTINASAAAIAARKALDYMSKPENFYEELPGKFGIIYHSETSAACNDRVNTFLGALGGQLNGVYGPAMGAKMAKLAAQRGAQAQQGAPGGEDAGEQSGGEAQQGGAPEGQQGGAPEGQQGGAPDGQQGGAPQGQQGGAAQGQQGEGMPAEFFLAGKACCNGDAETAKQLATQMIKEHPDLRVLYATNERSTMGVCEAVKEARNSGNETAENLIVIGFNANNAEQDYILNDILEGTMLQNPYNIGYMGVMYAGSGSVPAVVDTGVVYVNKQNLGSDEIQLMLDPKTFIKNKK